MKEQNEKIEKMGIKLWKNVNEGMIRKVKTPETGVLNKLNCVVRFVTY